MEFDSRSLYITPWTKCAGINTQMCDAMAYDPTTGHVKPGGFIRFRSPEWSDDRPKWRCERCTFGIMAQPRSPSDAEARRDEAAGTTDATDRTQKKMRKR